MATAASPTSFLDRQINTYGNPAPSARRAQGQRRPQQPQAPTPLVMPNGQPQPAQAQAPQQPQQPQPQAQQFGQGNAGSVNAEGVYTAGQAPTNTYQAQQVAQFQMPQNQQLQGQTNNLLQQLMQNPQSMNPQVVGQMKGQLTDQAASLERQTMGQLQDQLAARGLNVNSGYGLGQQRSVMADTNRSILDNFRNVDLQANQQNRQDLLQALGLGNQMQNDQLSRALQGYQGQLAGLGAQRDENLAAQNAAMQAFQANQGMLGQQSSSLLNAVQNRLQGQSLNNQASQFAQSLGFDREKFGYQKELDNRQFDAQAAAQSAAQSRWEDEQAMIAQNAQREWEMSMIQYLMGGGNGAPMY